MGEQLRQRVAHLGQAVLAGAVLGPAVQMTQAALWPAGGYVALGLAAGVLGLLLAWSGPRQTRPRRAPGRMPVRMPALVSALLITLCAASLAFALTGLRATVHLSRALAPALEGVDIDLTGTVAALPRRDAQGVRFRLQVESAQRAQAEAGQAPVRLPPLLALSWYGGAWPAAQGGFELDRAPPDLRAGERWRMTVRLRAPHGQRNPHGFDYELWLWGEGVQAVGYVRAGKGQRPPQRLARGWRYPVEQLRHATRDAIQARVADPRLAGILAALVAGDQAAIDRADWDVFRATGVAHLMSISGLHVTLFAWAAALAVGAAWRRSERLCLAWPAQHAALAGGVGLAIAYAVFSGWGVPAQRTVWMLATVSLLRLAGLRWPWPLVWLLACAVVVTVDPWALLQPGFWLSFVAVGVLFATDARAANPRTPDGHAMPVPTRTDAPGGEGLDPAARDAPDPAIAPWGAADTAQGGRLRVLTQRLRAQAVALAREQGLITLALAPLTLLLFGQVSLVGLVANLLAIPWVTLLVTPLALAGTVLPPAWDAAALALQVLSLLLQRLAALPLAVLTLPAAPMWAAAAAVAGGLLLVLRLPPAMRLAGLPLLLPVLLWQAPRPPAGEFELLAADVGQGNAVIVRTATRTLLYDSGPRLGRDSDAGHRVLVPLLRALGERVDLLVISHRDSDHTGGAAAVLTMQPQAALLASLEDGHELLALRRATRCAAGQHWTWDGVRFEVLHPLPAVAGDTSANTSANTSAGTTTTTQRAIRPNARSCVLRVVARGGTGAAALLAGDIERPQEAALAARDRAALRADALLVPHHGSKTSSGAPFLDAVAPRVALVQAGYRNRFGHPAAEVVARLRERGATVVSSPDCGAAHWQSSQPRQVRCERASGRRYWHHPGGPKSYSKNH